jgi:acetate kinase
MILKSNYRCPQELSIRAQGGVKVLVEPTNEELEIARQTVWSVQESI